MSFPFLLHVLPISSSLTWRFYLRGKSKRAPSLCNFLQPPVTSLFGINILLSTLFSNTLSPSGSGV
jgi:hypothetical protein